MTAKLVSLQSLVERKLALQWLRQRGLGVVQRRAFGPDVVVHEGPFYENRAMRRAQGQRGHTFGFGAMAPSIRTRGR